MRVCFDTPCVAFVNHQDNTLPLVNLLTRIVMLTDKSKTGKTLVAAQSFGQLSANLGIFVSDHDKGVRVYRVKIY